MSTASKQSARTRLSGRLGFLMLAAGCAVGLGNVWRFPFIVGRNGGAAFVLVYLAFLALLGFPLLAAELAVGRGAQRGIAGALGVLAMKARPFWKRWGVLVFAGNVLLMAYYVDVAGWLLRYVAAYAPGGAPPVADGAQAFFGAVTYSASSTVLYGFLAIAFAAATCLAGVVKGVERVTKGMMLSLLALLSALAAFALTLPGAADGMRFYLAPDWTPLLAHPFATCFEAMGQAFFTLSVGVGAMTVFGSYVSREKTLVTESAWIVAVDTTVALLAGVVVFAACATYHVDVTSGPGLVFVALPETFAHLPAGRLWGFCFFAFLALAALTTVIAVFECIIGGLVDELHWTRRRTVFVVAALVAVASLPATLSTNLFAAVRIFGKDLLSFEDFVFSQFWLPVGALTFALFCSRSWGWGWERFRAEVSAGAGCALPDRARFWFRWGIPLALVALLVFGLV